ncbi:MAG: ferritin family protein [Nitrospirota bacterium]|nr:ferritin family protein [Nitrospirota bacterium]
MMTGKEDLLSALIEAYLMEKGTRMFYSDAAAKAVKPGAKKMFAELSDWEESHMNYIQYLYQAIEDDRNIQGFRDFTERTDAPLTESGIPVKEMEAELEEYTFADDDGAMKLALEMEGKAYNLYRKLSEKAPDSNARVVFREMMEQELKHIEYLKKMRA